MSTNKIVVAAGGEEYEWYKFDIKNLRFGTPENKKMPETSKLKGTYVTIKIEYNYGTPESPSWRPFKINAPKQHGPYGVSKFQKSDDDEASASTGATASSGSSSSASGAAASSNGKVEFTYSLSSPIDFNNAEQERLAEIMHELYVLLAIYLSDENVANLAGVAPICIPGFMPDQPPVMGNWEHFALAKRAITAKRPIGSIAYPLKFSKIKGTKQNDLNSPLKMSGEVKFDGDFASKFTNCPRPGEDPISILPAILTSNKFDHITMYNISSVYIGSTISIQKKVSTSILTSRPIPKQGNNVSFQGSAYKRLQQEKTDEELTEINDVLTEMMAASMQKKDGGETVTEAPKTSTDAAIQPTSHQQLPSTPGPSMNNHDAIRAMMSDPSSSSQAQFQFTPMPAPPVMQQPQFQPPTQPQSQYQYAPMPAVPEVPAQPLAQPPTQYQYAPMPAVPEVPAQPSAQPPAQFQFTPVPTVPQPFLQAQPSPNDQQYLYQVPVGN